MSFSELKFLVDVGVSKQVEEYLQEQGYDTKTVRGIDSRMSDQEITTKYIQKGQTNHYTSL